MATRWGIVSAGKMNHDFVSAVRTLPTSEHLIVAVAALDLKRAQEFAEIHGIPTAYGSYEELAKDENIEIAYVATINPLHLKVSKLMLKHGKHVLVEKPMCMNVKETQELVAFAKSRNLFLMEAVWSRFFPLVTQLNLDFSDKIIGDIVHVNVSFGFDASNVQSLNKKDTGGGGTLGIGIYAIDALISIFKEAPLKVKTVGEINDEGVDTCLASSFLFSKGRTANVVVSITADLPNELEVIGTKGTIKVKKPFHAPTEVLKNGVEFSYPLPDTALPCNYVNSSGLRYEAMAVRSCLKQGFTECPQMPFKDSELNAQIRDQWRHELGVVFCADK